MCSLLDEPFKQSDESTAGSDQVFFFIFYFSISSFILALPVLLPRLILLHIIVPIDKYIPSVSGLSFILSRFCLPHKQVLACTHGQKKTQQKKAVCLS